MVEGGFAYGYLFASQHYNTPKVFKQFLSIVQPARIIEIGTFHGGLTLLLRDALDELGLNNSIIQTYDINSQDFLKPLAINRKIDIYTENLFNTNYDGFRDEETKQKIVSFIKQDGCSLVLCDGGCKKCEFNILAPLLKPKDIIMAHDYAPNEEYFDRFIKGKIWDWLEIQDMDIIDSIKNNNLIPYLQDSMQNIAWCCRMRELEK